MEQKNNNNTALTFYDRSQDFLQVRLNEAQFPRIKDITPENAFPTIKAMVVGAAMLRGTGLTDTEINTTAEAFISEVWQDFPGITLPEIGKAIRNGCFEKYGQVYGLNAVSLYKMVQGYQRSSEAEMLRAREQAARDSGKTLDWMKSNPAYLDNMAKRFIEGHKC